MYACLKDSAVQTHEFFIVENCRSCSLDLREVVCGFVGFDCELGFLCGFFWFLFFEVCFGFKLDVFVGFGFCFILTTAQYCPFWNGNFLFSLEWC